MLYCHVYNWLLIFLSQRNKKSIEPMLTQLTEIYIYSNKLTCLPPEIGSPDELRDPGASENSLADPTSESIENLVKLRVLDVRHNKLNQVGTRNCFLSIAIYIHNCVYMQIYMETSEAVL